MFTFTTLAESSNNSSLLPQEYICRFRLITGRFSQNAFLCLMCERGLRYGFLDRLMLSHLHTEACFPIKSVWLPLSLPCVCAADCSRALLYTARASMERYRKGSERNPPSPSITSPGRESREGRRTEEEMEVATGSSIWRNEGKGRKVAEWMEQLLMELVLIEPGSPYSLEIRMGEQC